MGKAEWTIIAITAVLLVVLAAVAIPKLPLGAWMGRYEAIGKSAHVICYSGGKVIYDGYSTGKVVSEGSSDGYFFVDLETGRPTEVSGNCVLTYGD